MNAERHHVALIDYRYKALKPKEPRDSFNGSEKFLQAMQNTIQIVGKVITPIDAGRFVVETGNDRRYLVRCRPQFKTQTLKLGMRIILDPAVLSIIHELPREVDLYVFKVCSESPGNIKFNEIGGLQKELMRLREVIETPLYNPDIYQCVGLKTPKATLIHGLPGVGKSLLVRAIAAHLNVNYVKILGSEVKYAYIGKTSRIVNAMFDYAQHNQPCLLFIDEIQHFTRRNRFSDNKIDSQGDNILYEIFEQLDGYNDLGRVKVVMATNKLDNLDPALMRTSRFDRKIEIPLPNEKGRFEILKIHSRFINKRNDLDFKKIAKLTPEFSGNELRCLLDTAGRLATQQRSNQIGQEHLLDAAKTLCEQKKQMKKLQLSGKRA